MFRSYAAQVWSRSSAGIELRLGGIEFGGLIEVVGGRALGDLFRIRPPEDQAEFRLGRSSSRMERGRGVGLADMSKEVGETVEELQRRESEGCVGRGIGFGQDVEDLIGSVADEVESLEGEGRPGAGTG